MSAASSIPAVAAGGFLLLSRAGVVWGVANAAVSGVGRRGAVYRVLLGGTGATAELAADEILGVVEGLEVSPPPAVLRRFWPVPLAGTAVYGGTPLVLLDPERPPQALEYEEGDAADGRSNERR